MKHVIFVAVALISILDIATGFTNPNSISLASSQSRKHKPANAQVSIMRMNLKCTETRIARRAILALPFSFPILVSAIEQGPKEPTKISAGKIPKIADSSSKSETKSASKKENDDSSSLAMKECDTPPKQESSKQEICEVDY